MGADTAMNESPRMSREEAAARADALIAEHRTAKKKPGGPRVSGMPRGIPWRVAVAIAYLVGVGSGSLWHGHAIAVMLTGLPVVLIFAKWIAYSDRGDEGVK